MNPSGNQAVLVGTHSSWRETTHLSTSFFSSQIVKAKGDAVRNLTDAWPILLACKVVTREDKEDLSGLASSDLKQVCTECRDSKATAAQVTILTAARINNLKKEQAI